jgi:uncharacterized protein (TIGR03118 family)
LVSRGAAVQVRAQREDDMRQLFRLTLPTMTIAVSVVCAGAWRTEAATYVQTNLVSDINGLATVFDSALVNSWGLTSTPTSPFWISDQGTNNATLYAVTGSTNVTKVTAVNPPSGNIGIPTTAAGPQGPTGTVANTNTSSFPVSVASGGNGAFAHFLFANLNGTISAWNTGPTAFTQVTTPGAVYTGLAINGAQNQIYAANDAGTAGSINVFSSSFAPVTLGTGAFATPSSISALGLVPFNVQDIGGNVYVTYAPSGRMAQQNAAQGQGAVAVFSESGALLTSQPMLVGGTLAAPWGVAIAPSTFGQFANDLLVGNFSYTNSFISAFDLTTGHFQGMIQIAVDGNSPGGLWALMFGIGGNNGSPNTLYFTDGIDGETHGLFGAINPTPLPAALPLFATGLGGLGLLGWRRKRKAQAAA